MKYDPTAQAMTKNIIIMSAPDLFFTIPLFIRKFAKAESVCP